MLSIVYGLHSNIQILLSQINIKLFAPIPKCLIFISYFSYNLGWISSSDYFRWNYLFNLYNTSFCYNCPFSNFNQNTDYGPHADNRLIANVFPVHHSAVANSNFFPDSVHIVRWSMKDYSFFYRCAIPYFNSSIITS